MPSASYAVPAAKVGWNGKKRKGTRLQAKKLIPRLLDKRWDVLRLGFNRGRLQTVLLMKQTYGVGTCSSCQVTRLERQTVQYARPRSEVL